jgi:hypothetical protein
MAMNFSPKNKGNKAGAKAGAGISILCRRAIFGAK